MWGRRQIKTRDGKDDRVGVSRVVVLPYTSCSAAAAVVLLELHAPADGTAGVVLILLA